MSRFKSARLAAVVGTVSTLAVAVPSATAVGAAAPQPPRPNVIVILADDLGYGDTGAYGSRIVKTPNIDALAADGVRFTQGYVTHPVCSPSRAGLLTGRYQTRFGWEFNPVGRDRRAGVSLGETFVPQIMKSAGYATGMIGKWHLGEVDGYYPTDRGFDEFFGVTAGASAFIVDRKDGDEFHTPKGAEASYRTTVADTLPPGTSEADRMPMIRDKAPVRRGKQVVEEKRYLTDAFTAEAVNFIGAHKDKPFFLYVAHTTPHTPLQATAKYIDRYRDIQDPGKRVYAAMVSSLDDSVGAIRAKLKAEGLEKNTLIVFLSDNGCAGYVLGACTNAPLNGFKGTHLEGGVRVPFIVAWPGHIQGGRVDPRTVSSLDITPTAAALAGATLPKGSDGVNLMPYIAGPNKAVPNPTLFWRAGANFAIRDGDWKMWLVNRAEPGEKPAETPAVTPEGAHAVVSSLGQYVMLYDLKADPSETRNLAAAHPDVVARLRAKIEAWDKSNVAPQWTSMRQSVQRQDGQLVKIYD